MIWMLTIQKSKVSKLRCQYLYYINIAKTTTSGALGYGVRYDKRIWTGKARQLQSFEF